VVELTTDLAAQRGDPRPLAGPRENRSADRAGKDERRPLETDQHVEGRRRCGGRSGGDEAGRESKANQDDEPAPSRRPRWRWFVVLICLALSASFIASRSAAAAAASLHVLVGFKRPPLILSSAVRASILTRTRERARITALRGQVRRQFHH